MVKEGALADYRRKRDFRRTPEPRGGRRAALATPHFVVQKHQSSTLHYDFRLQVDGVLESWAIPKGPSLNPRDKRLAVRTEDHPLEYQNFEGVIPQGEYGAGTVLVWDTGSYRNLTERKGHTVPLERAIEDGHVLVWLQGHKLRGGYALTRLRTGKQEAWLLVKTADAEADPRRNPVRDEPASVLSGRTTDEMAAAQEPARNKSVRPAARGR